MLAGFTLVAPGSARWPVLGSGVRCELGSAFERPEASRPGSPVPGIRGSWLSFQSRARSWIGLGPADGVNRVRDRSSFTPRGDDSTHRVCNHGTLIGTWGWVPPREWRSFTAGTSAAPGGGNLQSFVANQGPNRAKPAPSWDRAPGGSWPGGPVQVANSPSPVAKMQNADSPT